MHSQATLTTQLSSLGLSPGDHVMVHASMRKIGPVSGQAEAVIKAIIDAIDAGSTGTMVMLLGSPSDDIFDPATSPIDPEMGILAEVFRQYPGVLVSDHPACRCAAFGRLAPAFTSSGPLHDYYGPGSMLEAFIRHQGKILRLGANIDTVTLTHHAEYLADVSPKKTVSRTYITKSQGSVTINSLDDCLGIQNWPHGDYFSQILSDYLAQGRARTGPVGNCKAELLAGADFCRFAVSWMEQHLTR